MDYSDNSTEDTVSTASQAFPDLPPDIDAIGTSNPLAEEVAQSLQRSWAERLRGLFRPDVGSSVDPLIISSVGCRPGDPAVIRFPVAWGSQYCPMLEWYHMQQSRSRVFTKFQYRKERQKPFCHEFIILRLLDGGICRVERLGDPNARIGALTSGGTQAYDVIQLLAPHVAEESVASSDVVTEICLPQEVDILQVLAICYAIKQHEQACRYTLQRYNCYFFSWTILLILTRRISGWEHFPREYSWDLMMPDMSNELMSICASGNSQDLAFRITRLLSPERKVPRGIFFEDFRPLITSDDARESFSKVLLSELWADELNSAFERMFRPIVYAAAGESARHPRVGQPILEEPHRPDCIKLARKLLSTCSQLAGFGSGVLTVAQRTSMRMALRTHHAMQPPTVFSCLASKLRCLTYGTFFGSYAGLKSLHAQRVYSSVTSMLAVSSARPGVPPYSLTSALTKTAKICLEHVSEHIQMEMLQQEVAYFRLQPLTTYGTMEINHLVNNGILSEVLNFIEHCQDLADDEAYTKAVVYAHLESKLAKHMENASEWRDMSDPSMREICTTWDTCWRRWLWESTKDTILEVALRSLMENEPRILHIATLTNEGTTETRRTNTRALQVMVNQRIQAHGQRVATYQLGEAGQVIEDIKTVMDNVWFSYTEIEIDRVQF